MYYNFKFLKKKKHRFLLIIIIYNFIIKKKSECFFHPKMDNIYTINTQNQNNYKSVYDRFHILKVICNNK